MFSVPPSSGASQRSSTTIDSFRTFMPSKGPKCDGRLERHRFRKPMPDIATAVSTSGWLATASHDKVRLYNVEELRSSSNAARKDRQTIKCKTEWGKIRAIALSHDLLAIVTFTHLIVFEYAIHGGADHVLIDTKILNPNDIWTPQSVAIWQVDHVAADEVPFFWIAVGGQGQHGVRIYQYTRSSGYGSQGSRTILRCPGNATSVKLVGFSPERQNAADRIVVVGATDSNQIYCWGLHPRIHCQVSDPNWMFNCNGRRGGVPQLNAIRSAQAFLSPAMKMYLFCATDQKHGSQTLRSFIVPLGEVSRNREILLDACNELPPEAVGRSVLCGGVSSHGRYIAVIEQGIMRLLTLYATETGSLASISMPQPLEWRSSLSPSASEVSAISIAILGQNALDIVGVDGRGNVELRTVHVQVHSSFSLPQTYQHPIEASSQSSMKLELPGDTRYRQEMPANDPFWQELPVSATMLQVHEAPGYVTGYSGCEYDDFPTQMKDRRDNKTRFEEVTIDRWSRGVPVYREQYQPEPGPGVLAATLIPTPLYMTQN